MFGANTKTDQPGRKARQKRHQPQQSYDKRSRKFPRALEHPADHPLLDDDLYHLRGAGRKLPTLLHGTQVVLGDGSLLQSRSQNIGRSDGVLDREIDPDAADRRHRMRGIAEA